MMMRPLFQIRFGTGFSFFLALFFVACLPDRASWSPDGKELHSICPSSGSVVSWDIASKKSKTLFHDPNSKAVFCFDAGKSGAIFFATDRAGSDPDRPIRDLHLHVPDGRVFKDLAREFSPEAGMSATADGSTAFYIRNDEAWQPNELWRADLSGVLKTPSAAEPPPTKRIFSQKGIFGYPCASSDGSKVLLTFETHIGVLDVESGKLKPLINATKELPALYGVWALNEKAIVYIECYPKKAAPDEASSVGELALFTLADQSVKRLGSGVSILRRPMLDPTGSIAYVTQAINETRKKGSEMEQVPVSEIQVVAFDLKTGERRIITSEPTGGFWPAPDPTGKKLAYYTAKLGTRGDKPEELILKVRDIAVESEIVTVNCSEP